ncbi:unnamed protein product [Owenia fusiformis]|uniref:PUM-HD domain-containing protein n=1 Tax=Owenia fusiformis TaxID=6347 RepID=A0A8S4N0U7_OWEFU|nr:unnamed protein product [Owenia fusiformis]
MESSKKSKKIGQATPKKMNISQRAEPEGNSVKKKNIPKIASNNKVSTPKMKKSKTPMKSKSPKSTLDSSFDETNMSKKKSKQNNKTKTSEKSKSNKSEVSKSSTKRKIETNESNGWEQAIEKARGQPDGGTFSAVNVKSDDAEESTWSPEKKKVKKSSVEEKKEKKPFKHAAKKFKKTGKEESSKAGSGKEKGVKRKGGNADTSEEKKPKLEEMKKKDRKLVRRQQKDNFEVSQKAKKIWEQLRRHNTTSEKRAELSGELFKLVKGSANQMIFAHDTARVVQCLMKYGSVEHRNFVFEELKDDVVAMSKSKYSKFFVKKMLKHGTKAQRNHILKCFYGHVKKLIRHAEAAEVVEYGYNDWANAPQRAALVEEFYGPSFALFKTPEIKTLEQIMTSEPTKRETILSNMRDALSPLIDKNILAHSLVHRIFSEFFTYANPKMRTEMIENLRESVVHMLHTRDGARVTMQCIWHGTAKDRKVIIKSFKTHIEKIAKEEYGHLTLLAIFDVVDDTKLVSKAILEELIKSLNEVAADAYGRKVLLYLLSPRHPQHCHSDIVKVLQQGDSNASSKKDATVRRSELLDSVSKPLLQYIVDNARSLVLNNSTLVILSAILTHAKGDHSSALEAVAKIAAEPFKAGNLDENFHIIEHPAGHLTMKRLILNDKERIKEDNNVLFSTILMEQIGEGTLKSWSTCNRGCFTIISLLDVGNKDVNERIRLDLTAIRQSLTKLDFKGGQILLKKLQDL